MSATTPEALLEHAAWVRRLARGLVADVNTAEDVEQDTWLAALTHAPNAGAGWGRGWLARVAQNLVHRSRRTRARALEREELAARPEAQPSAAEIVERADLTRVLVAHLLALEEPYRSTLLLRYFEELSPSEIAHRDGIPLRTVNTRLARGLVQLRERLDRSSDRESWLPALIALCKPRRVPLPIIPTLILMKTSTKILCAALLLLLIAGGAWLALRSTASGDKLVGAQPPIEPRAATHEPAVVPSEPPAGSERTAAPAPKPVTAPAPEVAALRGRVVDRSGHPIVGANVALSTVSATVFNWSAGTVPQDIAHTDSDTDGTFSIELAPSRVGELSAAAKGFGKVYAGRHRSGDFVELVLDPAGTIEGRVTRDPDGAPVEGAKIVVRGTENAAYNPVIGESVTDVSGHYRVGDLGARDYWVWLTANRGSSSLVETISVTSSASVTHDFRMGAVRDVVVRGHVTDAATSAPIVDAVVGADVDAVHTDVNGAFELRSFVPEKATKVAIKVSAPGFADKRVEAPRDDATNVQVALVHGLIVVGKVAGPGGKPVEGAQIALFDAATGQSPLGTVRARSVSGGGFEIGGLARDARYGIIVIADGLAAAPFDLPALDSERTDLGVIELVPAAALVATIVDDAGKPWTDCDTWLYGGDADRARLNAAKVEAFDTRFGQRMNKTRADGRVVFGELPAGSYVLKTRVGGRSTWVETPLTLEKGQVRDDLEVVIPRGLALRGRTIDPEGRPVAGVFLSVPSADGKGLAGSASTASDGAFDIAGLEPGECVLRSMMSPVTTLEARKRFASGKWTMTPGGEPHDLVLPLVTTITGRVVAADGKPRAGVYVSAWDKDASMADASNQTDANGQFKLSVRAGATFDLRATIKVGDTVLRGALPAVASGTDGVEMRVAAP